MRITNRNQISSYMKRMNSNLSNLTKSNNKMASQRSFDKAWENVADATRTMRVRRLIRGNEHSLTNIRDVQGRMNGAEENLKAINTILDTTLDRSLQGLNGTFDEGDREKIAAELDNLQKQMFSMMNGQYADEFLFSAAGSKQSGPPFKVDTVQIPVAEYGNLWRLLPDGTPDYTQDANGNQVPQYIQALDANGNPMVDGNNNPIWQQGWMSKTQPVMGDVGGVQLIVGYEAVTKKETGLTYNGMLVDELQQNPTTGKIEWQARADNYSANAALNPSANPYKVENGKIAWEEIPFNKNNYIDIGLGFQLRGESANPETAMQYTFSGAELFGVGVDKEGITNNIYDLLGGIRDSLMANDTDLLGKQMDKLTASRDRLMVGITKIGTSAKFSEEMAGILENDTLILQKTQNDLEAVDLPSEVINNKDFEMAWMVTLQLGAKVLPTSLFDFMR